MRTKPLKREEYLMPLIEDLGPVFRKPGDSRKTRMAVFECLECKEQFKTTVSTKAKKQKYCKNCARTDLKLANRDHPLYRTWATTKNKVKRTEEHFRKHYLDRGIAMCDEWEKSFDRFYDWSLENGWKLGLTIDRIDNDKGYSPDNCRWATFNTQSANQRQRSSVTGLIGVQLGRVSENGDEYYTASLKWEYTQYILGSSKDKVLLGKMYDSFIRLYNLPHTQNGLLENDEIILPTNKRLLLKLKNGELPIGIPSSDVWSKGI